jgi:AcrR family transcriptional regulator
LRLKLVIVNYLSGIPDMTILDIAKPRRRLSGQARQQQIVETVLDLVAEHGADGVSVQAIADRIGLTQPAVFRHFQAKRRSGSR